MEMRRNQTFSLPFPHFLGVSIDGVWEMGKREWENVLESDGELVWWLMARGGAKTLGLTCTCVRFRVPRTEIDHLYRFSIQKIYIFFTK